MLVLHTTLIGVPILSLQTGDALGVSAQPIIDPRKLKVVAMYATGPRITTTSVLHSADIREISPLGFIIDGANKIMELDESLVRLQEVISLNFSLVNKPVVDENNTRLGRVAEYVVENEGFTIQKLHVSQSMLKNFSNSQLIIARSQIVELTDTVIVVRAGSIKEPQSLMQMINPFRKHENALSAEQIDQDIR